MEAAWVLLLGFVLGAGAVLVALGFAWRVRRDDEADRRLIDEIDNAPSGDGRGLHKATPSRRDR